MLLTPASHVYAIGRANTRHVLCGEHSTPLGFFVIMKIGSPNSIFRSVRPASDRSKVSLIACSVCRAVDRGTCVYLDRDSPKEEACLVLPQIPVACHTSCRCSVCVCLEESWHTSPLKPALGMVSLTSPQAWACLLFPFPAAQCCSHSSRGPVQLLSSRFGWVICLGVCFSSWDLWGVLRNAHRGRREPY